MKKQKKVNHLKGLNRKVTLLARRLGIGVPAFLIALVVGIILIIRAGNTFLSQKSAPPATPADKTPSSTTTTEPTILPTISTGVITSTQTKKQLPTTASTPTVTLQPTAQSPTSTPKPATPKYSLSKSHNDTIRIHPGETFNISATLINENGSVVTDQSGIYYIWVVNDVEIANGHSITICTHGINPPCPEDNFEISAKKFGGTSVEVRVGKDGNTIAQTSFTLSVY